MAQKDSMMDPSIESLLNRVDSKFTLVTLASMRGRQINAYFNQLGEGLGTIVPPQVTSVSRKPLSIALEEIARDKITYTRLTPLEEDELAEEAVEEAIVEAVVEEAILEAVAEEIAEEIVEEAIVEAIVEEAIAEAVAEEAAEAPQDDAS